MKEYESERQGSTNFFINLAMRILLASPLFACGTLMTTDINKKQRYILSESSTITDANGYDPRKDYPKTLDVPNGASRRQEIVEWFAEGNKVWPGYIHNHKGVPMQTPRGATVKVILE